MNNFKKVALGSLLVTSFSSCRETVNPNEWVVSTATSWNTMTVSKAGDYIPRLYTPNDRMIILPATYLAADFSIYSKFQNRVSGNVNLTYQWRISDPLKFIYNAKSLTSSPTSEDFKVNVETLESLENSVVDKMIMDVVREYTLNKSANTDCSVMEKEIFEACRVRFADRGVEFASMSIDVKFSPQIEEALDVSSALELYRAIGQEELGKKVIEAKAGAANITTVQK